MRQNFYEDSSSETSLCTNEPRDGAILKVHKIEIFFGFDFEICIISLLVMWNIKILQKNFFAQAIIGGDTIFPLSLRLSGIEFSLVWD